MPSHWLKRDMWISEAGSLCYFSVRENKRLVLVDASGLATAKLIEVRDAARDHAFELQYKDNDNADAAMFLACESVEECNEWTAHIDRVCILGMSTMFLGSEAPALRQILLTVKNRRQKVEGDDELVPMFKGKLWKLKTAGDRSKAADWFEREMWLAKNGSLVYHSQREGRELVYYTSADLLHATYTKYPSEDSCKPYAFSVNLPKTDDLEFAPGEFAAETEQLLDTWISAFEKVTDGSGSQS